MSQEVKQHISGRFEHKLKNLQQRFLQMGGLAEEQLGQAIHGLALLETETEKKIDFLERKINQMEVEISEECMLILAKWQPAAGDLRLLLAINRSLFDLERIGDEACRIARIVTPLSEERKSLHMQQIGDVGHSVLDMLHQSLDAFVRQDVRLAYEVVRRDRDVDQEYNSMIIKLINDMVSASGTVPIGVNLMWVMRAIERVGDHVCNICEQVVYMVAGNDVRHQGLERMREEADQQTRSER